MIVPPNSDLSPITPSSTPTQSFRLANLLNQFQAAPETILLVLAVLIGGVTGMGVVTFHYLIYLVHSLTLDNLMGYISQWGAWTLACVPLLGGIIIGLMRWRLRDFGPGISSLIATAQGLREVTPLRPVTKMIAAAISIGTGASLGPEGPSVETGANFGMLLGQVMQVSQERQRLLLGAGAAAGLAAGFNAPIAGVFFALEVVLGTSFATSAVSVVLLAAVISALITQICLGTQPAFALPVYQVQSPWELPFYMGLGILAGGVSVLYKHAIKLAQTAFNRLERTIPKAFHPALGGLCVGVVALSFPQILGVGYETIEAMLQDVQFTLPLLLILLVAKLVMTALSLGSGLVGGMFAPAMFLGASLGSIYAKVLAIAIPETHSFVIAPPAYAMVGMAAVLAGSAKAPLTSILLLFELTRDYRIVLPLMAAAGLSAWLVESWKPVALTTSPVQPPTVTQDSLEPHSNLLTQILQNVQVAAAMNTNFICLSQQISVVEAALKLTGESTHCAIVVDDRENLLGIVTLQDINRAIARQVPQGDLFSLYAQSLREICTTDLLCTYPDESLAEAVERMERRGLHQLPVLALEGTRRVVGLLEKTKIAIAYDVAVTQAALIEYFPQLMTASLPLISEQSDWVGPTSIPLDLNPTLTLSAPKTTTGSSSDGLKGDRS